jgi:hypothetical protein
MCMIGLLDGADSGLFTLVRHKSRAYDHTFHTMSYVGGRLVSYQLLKRNWWGGEAKLTIGHHLDSGVWESFETY